MTMEHLAWIGVGGALGYYLVAHYRKTGAFI